MRVDENSRLCFEDGKIEGGWDLIVGAEGVWSRVRQRLMDVQPFFSGIAGYSLSIPNAEETAPAMSKWVNRGSVFAFSDGKSIMGQQMGDKSLNISVYVTRRDDPQEAKLMNKTKEDILSEFGDWSERMKDIIQATQGHIQCRSMYMLPVGTKWEHKKGITIIGDAAHLMTPFGGEGVNLAFVDALKLSSAIIDAAKRKEGNALDVGIRAFEKDMFARARKVGAMTERLMKLSTYIPSDQERVCLLSLFLDFKE